MSCRLDEFDPLFFGISPREAQEMDPQQRLFLEVAWEALEDAGHANEQLAGSATGVFAGAIWNDFAALAASSTASAATAHSATGRSLNMVANRVSYALGLRGPSMVFDSACSSSLLAVHHACQSLRRGESSMALAGGVNVLLDPDAMLTLTLFGGLSPDGRCKSFDASGDGFGRGEGCGVVVLKLLSRALADGDDVWATIAGSAVNNDGLTNGLTAPSPLAQRDVLRSACADAAVDPSTIDFVETHGTGTALGDPIEAEALGAVFGAARPADRPLLIGAVKSNIGHLEGAAGIAGVIKTALCLRHAQIPANLHFDTPNPHIAFERLGLRVPVATQPWPHDGTRHAGVSSFGWGGTNVHLVMRSAPPEQRAVPVAEPAPIGAPGTMALAAGVPRLAFVCSPHGHQWAGMGRLMMRDEPAFRGAFEACDRAFAEHAGWSLVSELFAPDDQAPSDVDVVQPVLFALQVALAAWFEDAGLRPHAVVGHSLGEIAAAVIAGIVDVAEGARIVYHYSAQQRRVAGEGGMGIVELPAAELEPELHAYDGRVIVAAENAPRSTNLVGPVADIEAVLRALRSRGVLCAAIRVDVPAHSPGIDPVLDDLHDALAGMRTGPGRIPMVSSVTGRPLPWTDFGPAYVVRNLRERVRFSGAIAHLVADGFDAFVELSAHPVLLAALGQGVESADRPVRLLAGMRRGPDDRAASAAAVAELAPSNSLADAPAREAPVVLSAASAEALREVAGRLAAQIEDDDDPPPVAYLAAAALRRRRLPNRLATVASHPRELAATLRAFAAGDRSGEVMTAEPASGRAPQVAFVFPGQGSQWFGMGRELLRREPVFHAAVRACDDAAQPFLDWSILTELLAPEAESRLDRIDVVQPMLFCLHVALARLWRSWGVRPAAVVGHSMGEVAAAHVAGALSLRDAAAIVCQRSRVMARASGRGAMLATELTTAEAVAAIAGREELVSVAVSNSPRSTVLSGDPGALEQILRGLEADEIFCRWVRVDVASHSPQMDALREELEVELADVQPQAGEIPIYSTVTGAVEDGSTLSTAYWIDNLRRPVLFGDQVDRLLQDGVTTFVELSAHPILLPAIQQVAAERGVMALALPSLRRSEPERATMLRSAAQLDIHGAAVELDRVIGPGRRAVRLPTYPWQRERFWPQAAAGEKQRAVSASHAVARGLLGTRLDPAGDPSIHYWDSELDLRTESIGDHRVAGAVVVPGAMYVAMALAVAEDTADAERRRPVVCDLAFFRRLILADGGTRRVQLALTTVGGDGRLQIFGDSGLVMHLVAEATLRTEAGTPASIAPLDLAAIEARMDVHSDGREYYRRLHAAGLSYGPAFRGIEQIASTGGEVLARLAPTSGISTSSLPPALLDAALQTVLAPELATAHEDEPARMYIGEGIECVRILGDAKGALWVHALVVHDGDADRRLRADLRVTDASGVTLVEVTGASFRVLDGTEPVIRRRESGDRPLTASASNGHATAVEGSIRATVVALDDAGERRAALEERVRECVGEVVRLPARRIELDRPLRTLGIDSVMSLELRNHLETTFEVHLSATVVWNHPTVRELGAFLGQMLGIEPAEPRSAAAVVASPSSTPVLTDESPRLALERELDELTAAAERI
jgi:acyl transferase domain-containing protein